MTGCRLVTMFIVNTSFEFFWISLTFRYNHCNNKLQRMSLVRRVFVTVGTTRFDALIEALNSVAVQQALVDKGYNSLVIQRG
jgi:hypothetical protein